MLKSPDHKVWEFTQRNQFVLGAGSDPPPRSPRRSVQQRARRKRSSAEDELHRLPLLVHQLAGLLEAGRTPGQLWADAARLHRDAEDSLPGNHLSPTLDRAARAALLGMSPVPVLRQAAQGTSGLRAVLWSDLAACVQASERSGAPLAGILGRYAQGLEAILDSRAARASALSGPQATVRLLTWLPVAGLGLGFLLGTNPLAVLAQSPLGWAAAGSGAVLGLAARFWSRRLMRRAVPPGEGAR
ncbi:type II secretion system F family protein [Arthrobacter gandavensis]|nr:type II secretion system F family protein [Arthrobacter gandavensis]